MVQRERGREREAEETKRDGEVVKREVEGTQD